MPRGGYEHLSENDADVEITIPSFCADDTSVLISPQTQLPIPPETKDLIIVNRQSIPVEAAATLELIDVNNGPIYETMYKKAEHDDAYARVVTLDWWYQALCTEVLSAGSQLMDTYSNFVFCANLLNGNVADVTQRSVWTFVSLFAFMELSAIYQCIKLTSRERAHKLNPHKVGDLIDDNASFWTWISWCKTYFAMVLFKFVGIDEFVKDIVIWLHPWKNVQPYCAFKKDGRRCYLIGFEWPEMFRCDRHAGQHLVMPSQLFLRMLLLLFKLVVAIKNADPTSVALCLPSICTIAYKTLQLWWLYRDRERHFNKLHKLEEELSQEECEREIAEEQLRRKKKALEKQKSVHFNSQWHRHRLRERAWLICTGVSTCLSLASLGVMWGLDLIGHPQLGKGPFSELLSQLVLEEAADPFMDPSEQCKFLFNATKEACTEVRVKSTRGRRHIGYFRKHHMKD